MAYHVITLGGHLVNLIDLQTTTFGEVPLLVLHTKFHADWINTIGGVRVLKCNLPYKSIATLCLLHEYISGVCIGMFNMTIYNLIWVQIVFVYLRYLWYLYVT